VVTNTSTVPLTIQALTDNIYGDVTRLPGTCNTAIGTRLNPGNTYSCRFQADFRGPAGASQTDIATVIAIDDRGNTVRDDDDAVVRITPVPPSITTVKTPAPQSLPEPGGTFTFHFTVTNVGPEPVTVTSLVDDVYGNLNGRGTCAIGALLAANGGTYSCSFQGNFFGNAGATQTDTITTTAVNDRGDQVTSLARATVTITDIPPSIRIVKTPDPLSRPEPGGTFRFTLTITNPSFEPITTTSLVDDIYGDLNGRGSCAIGIVLAANGGTYSCAFDGEFRGRAGDSQTDTVTVIAVDDEGTQVTATAKATVTLTPVSVPPVVQPPPPPPVVVVQTPPQVLVRTGGDVWRPAKFAGLLVLTGMVLVAASWKFGPAGLQLIPLQGGPGGRGPGGRGPGGGGFGPFGGTSGFSGGGIRPPRRPSGSAGGVGLLEPPLPAPAPEPPVDADLGWDDWVVDRASTPPRRTSAPVVAPPPVLAPDPPVAPAAPVTVSAQPEVLEATVVEPPYAPMRAGGALDAVALDAANAESHHAPAAAPPSGRNGRSRRFGSR
jgi:hypothetical protein